MPDLCRITCEDYPPAGHPVALKLPLVRPPCCPRLPTLLRAPCRRYMPVVPTVLVNGAEGIGTGWSTSIPNFNPRDIVANLRLMLDGEQPVAMKPWYRGFKGTIEEVRPLHSTWYRPLFFRVPAARAGPPPGSWVAPARPARAQLRPHCAWPPVDPPTPPTAACHHPYRCPAGAHQDQRQVVPDLWRDQPGGRHHPGHYRAAHPQVDAGWRPFLSHPGTEACSRASCWHGTALAGMPAAPPRSRGFTGVCLPPPPLPACLLARHRTTRSFWRRW